MVIYRWNAPLHGQPTPVQPSIRGWVIWSLAALAFGYAFFQRVTPGVMVSDLMRDFAIGGGMLGVLSALYFYPYVLLQVPLGALLERLGARMLLFWALLFAGAGSFLFAMAESLVLAYLGRTLIGIGSAVGFLGSLSLAGRWFPPHMFALLTGLTMFFAMMSGVLGQAPLAVFVEAYGWRASQWALGIFGVGLAVLILLVVRNVPGKSPSKSDKQIQPWSEIWLNLKRAAILWNTWKIALVAAAMSGPMLVLAGLWGVPYVIEAYGLERANAAFLVSLMLFGWAIGAPINGWLSDHLRKRKLIIVSGCAVLTLGLGLFSLAPNLPLVVSIGLLFVCGFAGSAMAVSFALVRETTDPELVGSALGIVNAMTVASGALLQPIVGLVLDLLWGGRMENGSRIYDADHFQIGFLVVLLTVASGLVISLTLKDNRS